MGGHLWWTKGDNRWFADLHVWHRHIALQDAVHLRQRELAHAVVFAVPVVILPQRNWSSCVHRVDWLTTLCEVGATNSAGAVQYAHPVDTTGGVTTTTTNSIISCTTSTTTNPTTTPTTTTTTTKPKPPHPTPQGELGNVMSPSSEVSSRCERASSACAGVKDVLMDELCVKMAHGVD